MRASLVQTTSPASPEGGPQPLRMRAELDGKPTDFYADASGHLDFEARVGPGEHRLTLVRQSEALVGEGQLVGFTLPPGARVLEWDRHGRSLLEFIGDSITVGFGNEGTAPCRFSSQAQAITAAFPWLVGERLSSDVRVVGWSGHGVIRNYGDRAEPLVPEQWQPAQPEPAVVFVELGANDWWKGDPGPQFVTAYRAFLDRIRAAYPHALIMSVAFGARREVLRALPERLIELEDFDHDGCVGHPSAKAHREIAQQITQQVPSPP